MNAVSRSMITAAVSLVIGALTMFGVTLSEETQVSIVQNLEAVIGGLIVLYGLVIGILRKFTSTPMTGLVTKEKAL